MINYSKEIKQEAVRKYLSGIPAVDISRDIGVCSNTIYNWTKLAGKQKSPSNKNQQKIILLKEYQALTDDKRGEWLRKNGLQTGHINLWMDEVKSENETNKKLREENRQLKDELKKAQQELRKKDKALAESAALLVLKKKYQHLWEEEDE